MENTERHVSNDFVRFTKEYWVEVVAFFAFVTVLLASVIYLF